MLNATYNNISVISWRSVLLVEETGVPRENHQPVTSHWQTSHNVVSSTPHHEQDSISPNPSLLILVTRSPWPYKIWKKIAIKHAHIDINWKDHIQCTFTEWKQHQNGQYKWRSIKIPKNKQITTDHSKRFNNIKQNQWSLWETRSKKKFIKM
jgi:hypothetical protein